MKLLAFDTSTLTLGVALRLGEDTLAREETGGAQASDRLLPLIAELLAEAGTPLAALDAIAFGTGPGAFTGLRTACAAAQGLALGADLPVLPVVTLAAAAEETHLAGGATDVLARLDARMDEWYWAHYRRAAGGWDAVVAPCLTSPRELAAYAAGVPQAAAVEIHGPQLAGLVSLAAADWTAGRAQPPEQALPLYIRDKVAQTTAERAAARAARHGDRP